MIELAKVYLDALVEDIQSADIDELERELMLRRALELRRDADSFSEEER
jgi:hypothetical protein